MYCGQNFLRGNLKVWAPVFLAKRAVFYTCHNWSWQNDKLAQRINCELFTDPSRSSRRHHVYFEVTLTCGPRRELLRTSLGPLVDICRPGRTCLSYQECGLRPIFCLFKRTLHLHFYHMHCTCVCENSTYTRNLTLIEKGQY